MAEMHGQSGAQIELGLATPAGSIAVYETAGLNIGLRITKEPGQGAGHAQCMLGLDLGPGSYRNETDGGLGLGLGLALEDGGPAEPQATVTETQGVVNVAWPAVPGAVGYRVYRAKGREPDPTRDQPLAEVPASPFVDTPGIGDWHYLVTAYSQTGRESGTRPTKPVQVRQAAPVIPTPPPPMSTRGIGPVLPGDVLPPRFYFRDRYSVRAL